MSFNISELMFTFVNSPIKVDEVGLSQERSWHSSDEISDFRQTKTCSPVKSHRTYQMVKYFDSFGYKLVISFGHFEENKLSADGY